MNIYQFMEKLNEKKIYFSLASHREGSIMIIVAVPGERWECEYLDDGTIDVEIFKSNGVIHGEESFDDLFERFSD